MKKELLTNYWNDLKRERQSRLLELLNDQNQGQILQEARVIAELNKLMLAAIDNSTD